MDDAKIYNVCLMRVKHQITKANERLGDGSAPEGGIILESYNTGDIEDIIDILELYDIEDRTPAGLAEKLEDLAYTVSVLVREKVVFDYDEKGNLGLQFIPKERSAEVYNGKGAALAAA
ncbi:MAG: hypothetical protein HZB62_10465 [Nitrospirae bacterium]|nr:hypothetical protein [Nitrospirota bacterium]